MVRFLPIFVLGSGGYVVTRLTERLRKNEEAELAGCLGLHWDKKVKDWISKADNTRSAVIHKIQTKKREKKSPPLDQGSIPRYERK